MQEKLRFVTLTDLTYQGVNGGIFFTKDSTLLYSSGCGISLYSHKEKRQELVPLADKGRHLTAIGEWCLALFPT